MGGETRGWRLVTRASTNEALYARRIEGVPVVGGSPRRLKHHNTDGVHAVGARYDGGWHGISDEQLDFVQLRCFSLSR